MRGMDRTLSLKSIQQDIPRFLGIKEIENANKPNFLTNMKHALKITLQAPPLYKLVVDGVTNFYSPCQAGCQDMFKEEEEVDMTDLAGNNTEGKG